MIKVNKLAKTEQQSVKTSNNDLMVSLAKNIAYCNVLIELDIIKKELQQNG